VRLFSIGHGARPFDDFAALLESAGVERLADIRRFPGSRHSPQFGREALERALAERGVVYRWIPRLGGRRPKSREPSRHTAWRVEGFRSYADYMDTPEFAEGLAELLDLAAAPTAFMCAEVHPSRCHRRLVSDKLWSLGHEVIHLVEPGRSEPHAPPPFLRVEGDRLRYAEDAAQGVLPFTSARGPRRTSS
jgi:uncharacterized protein (DUF488 family)